MKTAHVDKSRLFGIKTMNGLVLQFLSEYLYLHDS